jgi:PTH1 family peptidyl-tRNA hydrolase
MFLVAGLGNPGAEYAATRHNFGFMAADTIAESYGFSSFAPKFNGLWAEGRIAGEKVYLLKPLTFMNLSGKAVGEAVSFYKIPLDNVIVVHDDLDLAFGQVKAKRGGSNAGHNGLKSIDAAIGQGYVRIRLGIDHPKNGQEVISYVTSKFSKEQAEELPFILGDVAEAFAAMLEGGEANTNAFTTKLALLRANA